MKTLCFFTAQYPFGNAETFIENEIEYLSNAFEKVYIFPVTSKGQMREIPSNCEVVEGVITDVGYSRNKVLKNYFPQVVGLFYSELKRRKNVNQSKSKLLSECLRMAYKASLLNEWLNVNKINNVIFYSYWMEDWTTILSILKLKGEIDSFICRVHGFDLFEERNKNGFIPFRYFQLKNVQQVFSVSHYGQEYLQSKYPYFAYKITKSYLGTSDFGVNEKPMENELHFVSASNVIPLKRLHLIVEILKNVKIPTKWTHFGDGVLMDEIIKLAVSLPENIIVEFKGRKENSKILEFFKNEMISFFINVSDTEGLPVSIMEAISFGIPVIATDVGGTSEIVNDKTGVLIEKDFDPNKIAVFLNNFSTTKFVTAAFRSGVRDFWKIKFSAKKNYMNFIKELNSF